VCFKGIISFSLSPKNKLKILVGADVPADPNSGAAGTVYQTNRALRDLGHKVDEIWADEIGRKIQHGNAHYLLELPLRFRTLVRKRCEKEQYDVIQLSQPHAYLAAKDHQLSGRFGIFVNRSHGLELRVNHVLKEWLEKYATKTNPIKKYASRSIQLLLERHWREVARESDGIILSCNDDRDFLLKRIDIDPDNVRVIHHGVSDDILESTFTETTIERFRKILYVGQFSFFKAPHILAQVINQVLEQFPKALFTWVCSRNQHDQVRVLFNEAVQPRVRLIDWMPQGDLAHLYERNGIFLYPSYVEGAGKASLEAMAMGMCVVASDTSGMRDYIRTGENGFLEKVGDLGGFVKSISHMIENPERAMRIGKCAAEDAKVYTWTKCAIEAAEFYRYLIRKNQS